MTLPVVTAPEVAAQLHAELHSLVADLNAAATSEGYGHSPGLRAALTVVLHSVRELDQAVLPVASVALPSDAELGWVEPDQPSSCPAPVALAVEPARELTTIFMVRAENLNRFLAEIQKRCPDRKAPPALVQRFGYVLGFLFTEICRPLYRMYPELEPEWLREP
jgi:hypothetical protein